MNQFSNIHGNNKAAALIIVIFAMLVFSILGWALLNLESGDFEINLRTLNSEQALNIAEAGAQWAQNQLSRNFNCTNITNVTHTFGPGQYACNCTSSGNALTVITTGYVPSQANYRALRQVNLTLTQGGFSNVAAGGDRFDWNNTSGYSISVNGTIASPNFEGDDSDATINEDEDWTFPPPSNATAIVGPTSIPAINMTYFEDYAKTCGNQCNYTNGSSTFAENSYNNKFYYVTGNVTIDTGTNRNNKITFSKTSIVAEGNITIIGIGKMSISAHNKQGGPETFPNLATQNGNIISSAPDGDLSSSRDFTGLIYTQYGTIDFNCIHNEGGLMGAAIYLRGNIELKYADRYVDTTGMGISGNFSSTTWQEQ
ncbi:MAG: hypothetical protein A2Y00_04920 [Omnitrophica WOR_2 bacterium GWF2_43_52]|nr:MAG: hypothetical protein A2Y01_05705 [Omnitrophica WOR_2 bacterium GWC2_44_8]OGX20450.1 MAG: hypothetical protein A2Y00_04920 [Omnitrophica WOR_2 bacterium GWF2_43_52]OGX53033.1 MAG: hypothetical protein A2460_06485 [Omnitrophica WOR_2 bacterium RIFOXYC2_FULL_43_9]HAH20504.1 hypothetical protein [Candidatus Omnitrophota bacterium]HBG62951.1 hypothetical protein [Candidatus Omnitrophota bacterium]